MSLDLLRQTRMEWRLGEGLRLSTRGHSLLVDSQTAVWWRRPGWVQASELTEEEQELIEAEGLALFVGLLLAQRLRWVDHPWDIELAESKLHQLQTATELGFHVPASLVTNDPVVAKNFLEEGPIVAKPVSSGRGLAPYADTVTKDQLDLVASAPVLLQRRVMALSDLRVVTIGTEAFVWSRPRASNEAVDWRVDDPEGSQFRQVSRRGLGRQAVRLAEQLRLTFSVQDWLEGADVAYFLEVNPQGNWLFLDGAETSIVPALIRHLTLR